MRLRLREPAPEQRELGGTIRRGLRKAKGLLRKGIVEPLFRNGIVESLLGKIDYIRFPGRGNAWGGPFNGQRYRVALFCELLKRVSPAAIVETGTYLGTTTEFLADSGLPVFTVEAHARNYGFARARLRRRRNVKLLRADSREALRRLLDGPLRPLTNRTMFFYLDAHTHWTAELPLAEELEIVFERCPAAVVMVDDFQVPNEPGYAYDDYGQGKALTPAYIAPSVAAHALDAFYPVIPAIQETGMRRGCVVLARHTTHGAALAASPLLQPDPQCTGAEYDINRISSVDVNGRP